MSIDLWNFINISQPPNITCKVNAEELDLKKLSDVCFNAIQTLRNQDALHFEAATLSRLIYRMKTVFRSDKGLKSMEKVNRCLRNYLLICPLPAYQNFSQSLPKSLSKKEVNCPTLQMLEYLLVRTQGLGALLCRIIHTCHEAAIFIHARIAVGHNWPVAVTSLCVISRIWTLCRHLLDCCNNWYEAMLPFRTVLKQIGATWLPTGYTFPSDLGLWLSIPSLNKKGNMLLKSQAPSDRSSTSSVPLAHSSFSVSSSSGIISSEDVGEVVSRSEIFSQSHTIGSKSHVFASSPVNEEDSPKNIKLKSKFNKKKIVKKESKNDIGKHKTAQGKMTLLTSNICNELNESIPEVLSMDEISNLGGDNVHCTDKSVKFKDKSRKTIARATHIRGKVKKDKVTEEPNLETKLSRNSQHSNSSPKKTCNSKSEYISQKLSLLNSDTCVRKFIDQECCKRHLTSSLGDNEWNIMHSWLEKQYDKVKRVHNEEKKARIVNNIKMVLKTSLA